MSKNNKSRSYPRLTLSSAIDIVTEARKLGKIISKETLAGIGRADVKGSVKSGAFTRKLAALDQFGLVKVEKEGIKFTAVAEEIIYPTDNTKNRQSIIQAFLTPTTFFELYNSLSHNVPIGLNLIKNKAQKDLGITSAGISNFVSVFVESGELAGLVQYTSEDKNTIQLNDNQDINNDVELIEQEKPLDKTSIVPNKTFNDIQTASLTFKNGRATIQVEGKLSESDMRRLKAQIDVFAIDDGTNMEE